MERDGLSYKVALAELNYAKTLVSRGEDPEDVLKDVLGLELDYIFDLL